MLGNKYIQKRESFADTGPWVPGVTPFLFSLCLLLFLVGCRSSHPPEVKLALGYEDDFPLPHLQLSPRDFQTHPQKAWEEAFRVYVGDSLPAGEMIDYPVLGSYLWKKGTFSFRPRFPWRQEQDYFAHFDPHILTEPGGDNQEARQSLHFRFSPPRDTSHARVLSISPQVDSIPANALRLYLYFDAPMREDSVYQHVKLLDENGKEIPQAFVEVYPPLFDPSGQRLTLIFHPGRVKQGIEFGERIGPVLEAERSYSLLLDTSWQDRRGRFLAGHKPYQFVTTAADRSSPDPGNWEIEEKPRVGSKDVIQLGFDEALDAILASRMIQMLDENAKAISGAAEAENMSWRFVPQDSWKAGKYQIIVYPELEDLAGNRHGRLFDSKEKKGEEKEWLISFELE